MLAWAPPARVLSVRLHRNFTGGLGTQMLKRKRKDSDTEQEGEDRPGKRNRDVKVIAEHCTSRTRHLPRTCLMCP